MTAKRPCYTCSCSRSLSQSSLWAGCDRLHTESHTSISSCSSWLNDPCLTPEPCTSAARMWVQPCKPAPAGNAMEAVRCAIARDQRPQVAIHFATLTTVPNQCTQKLEVSSRRVAEAILPPALRFLNAVHSISMTRFNVWQAQSDGFVS